MSMGRQFLQKATFVTSIVVFVLWVWHVGFKPANHGVAVSGNPKLTYGAEEEISLSPGIDSLRPIAADHPACHRVWNNSYQADIKGWKQFYLSLRKYKKFHNAQLNCLRMEGAARNSSANSVCKEPVRTLTWACINVQNCSGIGDQFARIQLTFLLAMATNRVFTIYWNPKDRRTMRYLQPNKINWQFYDKTLGMHIHTDLRQPEVSADAQNFTALLSLVQQNKRHVTITHVIWGAFLRNYRMALDSKQIKQALQPLGLLDILRPQLGKTSAPHVLGAILRYLFKFSSEVMEKVAHTETSLGLTSKPYLAVHLRTGFYGTSFEEVGTFSPRKILKNEDNWTAVMECAFKSANSVLGSSSPIYLATDSYIVKQWALRKYGSRVRVANMTLQHVAMKSSWNNDQNSNVIAPLPINGSNHLPETQRSNGYEDTWVDFLLLARSNFLARGISSFATTAGELCSLPQERQGCLPSSVG